MLRALARSFSAGHGRSIESGGGSFVLVGDRHQCGDGAIARLLEERGKMAELEAVRRCELCDDAFNELLGSAGARRHADNTRVADSS